MVATTTSSPQSRIAGQTSAGGLPIVPILFIIAVCMPIFFDLGSALLSPVRLFLTLAFVPLAVTMVVDKKLKINAVDILLLCFLAWSIFAVGSRHPTRIVEWGGSLTLEIFGAYLVSRVCIRTRQHFIAFAKLIGLIVAATLPFAIIESQTSVPVIPNFLETRLGFDTVTDINNPPRLGLERAQVIMPHPIHYGVFASVAFSLTWVALAGEINIVRRGLVAAAVFAACFLSLSSGAFLSVLMQIGLIVWYTIFRNNARKWTYLFAIAIGSYVIIDIVAQAPPIKIFMRYAAFSAHTAYWRATIFEWGMINVWSSPWIGIGLADWVRPFWMRSASVDNYWLVHALRAGIPAFVFLAGAFVTMLWKLSRRDFSGDEQLNRLRRAYIFVITGLLFSLATVHIWTNIQTYVFFLLGSGAWMLTAEPHGETGSPKSEPQPRLPRQPRYTRFGDRGPARPETGPPLPGAATARAEASRRSGPERRRPTPPRDRRIRYS